MNDVSWKHNQMDKDMPQWLEPALDLPQGVGLYQQGELLKQVFYVSTGVIKTCWSGAGGEEHIPMLAYPGSWLGVAPVVAQRPTPVGAVTCARSRVSRVYADTFRKLLQTDQEFSATIQRMLAIELCRQTAWMGQRSTFTARQRLESVLFQSADSPKTGSNGSGRRVHLPLQRSELARLIAVTPEHLSRLIRQMSDEGSIRCEKGWIVIGKMDSKERVPLDALWCAATEIIRTKQSESSLPQSAL